MSNNEFNESVKVSGNDMKKLVFIIGGCIIFIIIVVLFIILLSKNAKNTGNSMISKGDGYEQTINIKKILKDVDVKEGRYPGKYIKILIEVNNKMDKIDLISLYTFELVKGKKNVVTLCYHDGLLPDSGFKDIISGTVDAKKTISGYLYCPTEVKSVSDLRIQYIADTVQKQDGTIEYKYDYHYVKIK